MHLNVEEVIVLEIAEGVEVKKDENRHYFRPAHAPLTLTVLAPVWLTNGHTSYFLVIFLAKIIDNTENLSNFVLGNLHDYSLL